MIKTHDYDYVLPPGQIARKPADPRDTSRLFVYDTSNDRIVYDYFYHLAKYLPKKALLVLNETKVLPSRIVLKKKTGGSVRSLFLVNERLEHQNYMRILVDRRVEIGDALYFNAADYVSVIDQDRQIFTVSFSFSHQKLYALLKKTGNMPIPLYIKKSPLTEAEKRTKYQTIFAKKEGSTAAPTASLHFTERVFKSIQKKRIETCRVTLHVGMGTFATVTEEQIKEHRLHDEWVEVSKESLAQLYRAKQQGLDIIASGTTVVRTLESLNTDIISPYAATDYVGSTNLFIHPPYRFQFVDHLITNFHLPASSLMMLVEAFLQHKGARKHLVELYNIAMGENFRFYSFGDAMLIL